MLTRRRFLQRTAYRLVLAGGTGWFTKGALAAAAGAGSIAPPDPGAITHGPSRGARGQRDSPPPPPPPGPAATPAWLKGAPLNHWYPIPGTELSASTDVAALIAAGLTNAAFQDIGYGNPRKGIMTFSGGTLKSSGSEMLIFGGGGAGAWAGNDVRGLRLEDDVPRWRVRKAPSPASEIPLKGGGDKSYRYSYNYDGTPIARHSYYTVQYIDSSDTLMTFGVYADWVWDSTTAPHVDGLNLGTGVWAPGSPAQAALSNTGPSHPDYPGPLPVTARTPGICKHPLTEHVYVTTPNSIWRFDPAANSWQQVGTNWSTDPMRGAIAIDTSRNLLLHLPWGTAPLTPTTVNLDTGQRTSAILSGPYANSIWIAALAGPGFVYDAGIDKYFIFIDDGFLYTISYVSDSNWQVDRVTLSGTAPTAGHSYAAHGGGGQVGVWGRMQYVPSLRGICIIQAYDKRVYFVRTA